MFEEKTDLLREHIAYLKGILEMDVDSADIPEEDELQDILDGYAADVEALRRDLPYDELDDDTEPVEDFSGEELEDGELEDEVVEAEAVMAELEELMEEARSLHEDAGDDIRAGSRLERRSTGLSPEAFERRLVLWLESELVRTHVVDGASISRAATGLVVVAKRNGNHQKAHALAQEEYPQFGFTEKELFDYHMAAPIHFHIAFEMVKMYKTLHELMDFDLFLKGQIEHWKMLVNDF